MPSASPAKSTSDTPMMQQWQRLKAQAGDALLFFRLGDFFELFEDDAIRAAPVLGVTLTSRNQKGSSKEKAPPLCGVPAAAIEAYLKKVLDQGYSVALAEQTEDPSAAKGIVKREIIQWFTPGIRLLEDQETPCYAGFLTGTAKRWTLAAADVGTGHLVLESGEEKDALQDLLDRLPIRDLRTEPRSAWDLEIGFKKENFLLNVKEAEQEALEALGLTNSDDLLCTMKREVQALGSLLQILRQAHPRESLRYLRPRHQPDQVWLPANTRRHLDLFEPKATSLFDFLDHCQTAMGRRDLKEKLANPTQSLDEIKRRQKNIAFLKNLPGGLSRLRSNLGQIHDIHRMLRRRRGPRGLLQISLSLKAITELGDRVEGGTPLLKEIKSQAEVVRQLADRLLRSVQSSEEKDRGWIKHGVSQELDDLRQREEESSAELSRLEENTKEAWKVTHLKIKFHQVFGYVFEVSKSQKSRVPETAKRIQTLANAERYKTPALEEIEQRLLSLDRRLLEAERAEIDRLYQAVEAQTPNLLRLAEVISELDALQSLAFVASKYNWSTPHYTAETSILSVEKGVHPLALEGFVPLNFELNKEDQQVMLLTGPNMAGKSTLLRVAAICALLHQVGSDVPAANATLSLFDRIACRMGATDNISQGQSTFYVEMREVATMLDGATEASLLLFDELGRGTSTYDGMSLAWAITEEVHEMQALAMVATHYLELAALEAQLARLKNFHLGVKEQKGRLIFTRRLARGPASQSYGIQVASLAQISPRILRKAEKKLYFFERKKTKSAPLFDWVEPQ